MHDGRENTYTIEKEGVKHILVSIKEKEEEKGSSGSNKVMIVSRK